MTKLAILLVVGIIAMVYGDEPEPIVGGNMVSQGQFPHQISLREDDYHICGGSIISSTHILTAAHCITSPNIAPRLVHCSNRNKQRKSGGQVHKVKCVQVHSGFDKYSLENDIALLTLASPISFTSQQSAIPLASTDYANGQNRAMISGWGQLGKRSNMPTMLQYVDVTMLSHDACQKAHPDTSSKQICTFNSYGKGACMGDSGGPLIHNRELVGVVSWGIPCAVGEPDVFTSVDYFWYWIKEHQQKC